MGEKPKDLIDSQKLDQLPLELMPYLLEFVHQEFGYNGYGKEVMPSEMPSYLEKRKTGHYWNGLKRRYVKVQTDPRLSRLYDVIVASQSLPLLFARGPGEALKKVVQKKKNGKSNKPRKRRKFGDEADDDDEAWIPKGVKRNSGKWTRDWRTGVEEYIPPSVY